MSVYEKVANCVGGHLGFMAYKDIPIVYIFTSSTFTHSIPAILITNVTYPGNCVDIIILFIAIMDFVTFRYDHLGFGQLISLFAYINDTLTKKL